MKRPNFDKMSDKEQRQAQAWINNYLAQKWTEQTKTELEVERKVSDA